MYALACNTEACYCDVLFKTCIPSLNSLAPESCGKKIKGYYFTMFGRLITHWGRVTHICISILTIIGPYNGLSHVWRQAIIWTNAGILLINVVWKMADILPQPQCVKILCTPCETAPGALNLSDDKWTWLQVMAWCYQETSHHLNQRYPISRMLYGVTGPRVNALWPSDAIWQHWTGSTVAQVITCCLMAPSH